MGRAQLRPRTVRSRLLRILALPLVAVIVLLGIVLVGEVRDYRTTAATADSVELALAVQDLVQELQQERGLTAALLGGNAGFRDEIEPVRDRVDAEFADLDRLTTGDRPGSAAVRTALRQLADLAEVRDQVDAGSVARGPAFQFFTTGIERLNQVDYGLEEVTDLRLRRGLGALEALSEFKEQTARERAFLNGVYSAGGFRDGEYVEFVAMNGAQQAAFTQFQRQATGRQLARLDAVLSTGAASEAGYFEQVAQASSDRRLLQVNPQSWWSALTTVLDGVRATQQAVGADITGLSGELRGDAASNLIILLIMTLICLGGSVALVLSATRSITGPLTALADEADAIASQRLPTAVAGVQSGQSDQIEAPSGVRVPTNASAEIRSVATAFDRVQATAYALAAEQAVLRRNTTDSLANLGRRNQNLLRRQIGFITQLEREETDPSALANLFELDHLATRMRRNAESLLVLVGEATPRRWSTPLPIADVIRAAISEVEEYRRVTLRRIDEAFVIGTCVTNLAHIVAELVENGLTFSPPDQDVEIQGRRIGTGYLIAITDQGVGMGPDELAKANARLRGEESFLLSPTRFLGHYVVGQLAREMAVEVQVAPSPVTGITARVLLPDAVLAQPDGLPAGSGREVETDPVRPVPGGTAQIVPAVASGAPERPSTTPTIGSIPAPRPAPGLAAAGPGRSVHTADQDEPPVAALEWWGRPTSTSPVSRAPSDDPTTTRNGLPKRLSRSRSSHPDTPKPASNPHPTQRSTARSAPGRADRPPAADLSPTDMRRRLTALRDGVRRGENEQEARNFDG